MVLVLTNPRGSDGELAELLTTTQASQPALLQAINAAPSSAGLQASWAIDPTNGVDSNQGTPAAPLRTMGELSGRLSLNLIQQPTTVQLVGNVVDSPLNLQGTRFAKGASLTVSGTLTDVTTGTISVVTPLGIANGGAVTQPPWLLTTTGAVDWTTVPVGAQIRYSTGHVGMLLAAISATQAIVGCLAAPGTSISLVTPAAGNTLTVSTLSSALPPVVNATQIAFNGGSAITIGLTGLRMDMANNDLYAQGGATLQLYGCELVCATTLGLVHSSGGVLDLRACRVTLSGANSFRFRGTQADLISTFGLCVVGTGSNFFQHNCSVSHNNTAISGARLLCSSESNAQIGSCYFRNTAGPVLVNSQGRLLCNGVLNGTNASDGNTGIGIDVSSGLVTYFSSSKPQVSGNGGSPETRVGGVTKAYAAIPYVNWDATVPAAFTGNGAAIVQG